MTKVLIALFSLGLICACASEKRNYENWEHSRVQNCKQQYTPHDPEREYCIERATLPYEDVRPDAEDE